MAIRPLVREAGICIVGLGLLAFALYANAGWNFKLHTDKNDDFWVFKDSAGVTLSDGVISSHLSQSEAESLAQALLWAAGKGQAPGCTQLTNDENRFLEAGKRAVEKMREGR
jgi:hypothetical protein